MLGNRRRQRYTGLNADYPSPSLSPSQSIAIVDAAVVQAHSGLLAAGESVSAWRVSQSALVTLKADSFESLGFPMQHVPSLYRLMITEAKVNSFIHCYVGVQRLTSLYELELAICESEGIQGFEELGLGPLLKHPLVVHYFSVGCEITEVFKITSDQIISFLNILLHRKKKVTVDELLDYIAKRTKQSRENLCVRIQSLGMHIGHIMRGRKAEWGSLKKCSGGLQVKLENEDNGDDDEVNANDDDKDKSNDAHDSCPGSSPNTISSDPSAAKQVPRIWLDTEMDSSFSLSRDSTRCYNLVVPSQNRCCTNYVIHKRFETKPDGSMIKPELFTDPVGTGFIDNNEVDRHTWVFIQIWREMCRNRNVDEVYDQMLDFYQNPIHKEKKKQKVKRKAKTLMSSYPHAGLLNVAIASIKFGMWDCMRRADSKKVIASTISEECVVDVKAKVEPSEREGLVANTQVSEGHVDVVLEDILKNISTYFERPNDVLDNISYHLKDQLIFSRKLCMLERWLTEQHSVGNFESLGFGDFFTFLEKHASLLPPAWQNCFLTKDKGEAPSVKVSMSQPYLLEFLSQASNSLEEHETLSNLKVSELLRMQYPSVGLTLDGNGLTTEFLTTLRKNRSEISSNAVLFSTALCNFSTEKGLSGSHVVTKDAIELLLKAPMLTDLNSWSYWDLKFAASLGPLVGWLLSEVNTKELLCLVTREGKVLRIDHLATVDSFLEAFLQGSSFQTALELLSLFALYGGQGNVPFSLLKCHAKNAFEVIFKLSSDNESKDEQNRSNSDFAKAVPVASRFFLDCLGYLPKEFRSFAADLLLSGIRSIVKDAPSVILSECKHKDDHLMLHELGYLLGIVEWIGDYCSCWSYEYIETSDRNRGEAKSNQFSSEDEVISSLKVNQPRDNSKRHSVMTRRVENADDTCIQPIPESDRESNAADIIESIRRDEFGLDPNLSVTESSILKKQHARLGRALHCLSQELYSQDSHFLLELVQNADDNVYSRNVDPTLTFILQEKGIVVLNNEHGFSADNIRALCDVGNSTKKSSGAGYIGKKGIGFKSVFRVTDAPEIHSNGFHIKFDLSEGQIGFVLPTIVPSCNIDLFKNLVSYDTADEMDRHNWNTCIVLPFRSKLTETSVVENIISMFSDLHPSLLLFLHRLQCIKFRNMLKDSFVVMRKEIVGNGIINVSIGKEVLTWFVESCTLQANVIRDNVKTTEISIAFALEVSNGNYIPKLDQQYVFAFLPLRTYGLKFIIQGDFILPSSREEVDGDSPWNQWLLSEFPSLFVNSEISFCHLPGFRDCLGKGVSAFLSFVPLVGEVHGFFASLPRMIISKLCTSNCLLLEGDNNSWVPPCRVLRNWDEQVRNLLPDSLLQEHLGLGYLNKDIVLSDSLARALGIENYGPKILVQILASLCRGREAIKSMGLGWLSSWLNALYEMSFHHSSQHSIDFGIDADMIKSLRKISFIPLLDGSCGSIDEGMIWMNTDALCKTDPEYEHDFEAFTKLFADLRVVNPALFDGSTAENSIQMLQKVGVQRLSVHEVVKMHVLPAISDEKNAIVNKDLNLMTEYLSFIMVHLQSSCPNCSVEREHIISEVYNRAFILTNHGFVRPSEVAIHFSNDFGNHIDINRLINGSGVKWYEVDRNYLKYPVGKSACGGMLKWRKFFQDLRITDFVQIVQVEKIVPIMSPFVLRNMTWEKVIIPPGSTVNDWESQELVHLLSALSLSGDRQRCKHLLEVLDEIWDDYFSDKVSAYCIIDGESKPFKSSLVSVLNDVLWLASSIDEKLYHPKDLFHDCEAVRSILGDSAHYAVPKVQSENLVTNIGLRTTVTLSYTLSVLEGWKRSDAYFKASISQMSRFYSFIWNELTTSDQKIESLRAGAFIFVPFSSASSCEVVSGVFLSPQEVYWHDNTGSIEQVELISQRDLDMPHLKFSKMLSNVYPSLHDFFVNKCGVNENPPLLDYLEILLQSSTVDTPSKAAKRIFDVFLLWADGLKSGLLSVEDVEALKVNLERKELTVLPTAQHEWVSLHPSFGLVCWCDDEKLAGEFEELNNIDFVRLCELTDEEKRMLHQKISILMERLGIVALSEVVSREAIYYGPVDNSFETSLVSWALPYAQRYISKMYPDRYLQLKLSGFEKLNQLQIVVVEKLYYRNVIKRSKLTSKKRRECGCLLQDDVLYTTWESDSHALFMELSRFLIQGNPELQLANFLHMITTMTESGSTKDQIEAFISNSQKVPKLPKEEPVWSIRPTAPKLAKFVTPPPTRVSKMVNEPNTSNSKQKSRGDTNWPPVSWRTAPRFTSPRTNDPKMQYVAKQKDFDASKDSKNDWSVEEHKMQHVGKRIDFNASKEGKTDWNVEEYLQEDHGVNVADLTKAKPDFVDHGISKVINEPNTSTSTTKSRGNSIWLPVGSRTAPTPKSAPANDSKMQYAAKQIDFTASNDDKIDWNVEEHVLKYSESSKDKGHGVNVVDLMKVKPDQSKDGPPIFSQRDQLSHGTVNAQQAFLTGRRGEEVAYNYFLKKFGKRRGKKFVTWVNKDNETGLPYDIEICDKGNGKEYIEVKTTDSARKDWFEISVGEWQFAAEKGECFSVVRVVLSAADKTARVMIYKNPAKLCQLGHLKLAVVVSKQQEG